MNKFLAFALLTCPIAVMAGEVTVAQKGKAFSVASLTIKAGD
jgi:hypothetical protein